MINIAELTKEELDKIETERAEHLKEVTNDWMREARTTNPVINDMRFNHNYLYIRPYLFDNVTYGKFELYPYDDKKKIHIAYIGVGEERRRTGIGTKMMKLITELADKYGYTLDLTVEPKFGVGKRVLNKFYKSHGFVFDKGRFEDNRHMVRKPCAYNSDPKKLLK